LYKIEDMEMCSSAQIMEHSIHQLLGRDFFDDAYASGCYSSGLPHSGGVLGGGLEELQTTHPYMCKAITSILYFTFPLISKPEEKISAFLEAAMQMSFEKRVEIPATMTWAQVLRTALKKIDLQQTKARVKKMDTKKRSLAGYASGMLDADGPVPPPDRKRKAEVSGGDGGRRKLQPKPISGEENETSDD
jgi:hypothetical protein